MNTKPSSGMKLTRGLLLLARLALAGQAQAALLSVDLNDPSRPADTQTGFSALVAPGDSFTNLSGTFGGVTVTISGLGEPLQSAVRNAPTNNSSGVDKLTTAALYQDFVYGGNAAGNGLSVLLSGLAPGQNYLVKLWSYDALSSGSHVSDWT